MKRLILIGLLLGAIAAAQTAAVGPNTSDDGTTVTLLNRSLKIGTTVIGAAGALAPIFAADTSTPVTVTVGGFYWCNVAACVYNLPVITTANIGMRICVTQEVGATNVVTLKAPTSTVITNAGVNTASVGYISSGGALGDQACVVARAVGTYQAFIGGGTWATH